jgi:hypothetical protein
MKTKTAGFAGCVEWKSRVNEKNQSTFIISSDGAFIARTDGAGQSIFPKSKDWKLNARLIAAAPDMLVALKAAKVFLLDDDLYAQSAELRKTIDNAIAKAEGK